MKVSSFSVQCVEFQGAHMQTELFRRRRHHTKGPASQHFCAGVDWHWSTSDSSTPSCCHIPVLSITSC